MVAATIANMKVGGDKRSKDHSAHLRNEISTAVAAKQMNVGTRSVEAAKKVLSE